MAEPGDPDWLPAFDDLMAAAMLIYDESRRVEGCARAYQACAADTAKQADPRVSRNAWQDRAEIAIEHARQLNRAAAVLDWVARRADRLTLLTKGVQRERRR